MAIFSGEFTNDDFVFHWDNNNRISDFDSILLQLYGFQLVYNGNFINQLDPALQRQRRLYLAEIQTQWLL